MKMQKAGEMTTLKRLFHSSMSVISVGCMLYGVYCMSVARHDPRVKSNRLLQHGYENSPFFISMWGIGCSILYYQLHSAIDITEVYFSNNKALSEITKRLHQIASYLLFAIVFPMSLYILIAFWIAFVYFRELIYPRIMDEFVPPWINHCLHTLPVPVSLLYMFTSNRHIPSKQSAISGIVAFLAIYWGLFVSIRMYKGKWVYSVIEELNSVQIFLFILSSLIVPIVFLNLGYIINSKLRALRKLSNIELVNTSTLKTKH